MTSAYKIADRIVMLHKGRIIADGDAEHIRNHHHPVVQHFINGQVSEDEVRRMVQEAVTDITPFPPTDMMGNVRASSPESTVIFEPHR